MQGSSFIRLGSNCGVELLTQISQAGGRRETSSACRHDFDRKFPYLNIPAAQPKLTALSRRP